MTVVSVVSMVLIVTLIRSGAPIKTVVIFEALTIFRQEICLANAIDFCSREDTSHIVTTFSGIINCVGYSLQQRKIRIFDIKTKEDKYVE